ncbi:hypothetical protein NFIA_078390 [Paecilomyces variotii No. 5]|uniref:Uncharacterized protein n=1 Tax=Byssochlamys spectabilis (strain No. 5 / NBRC 109023) TaxID=1356009 RepID=V5G6N8_BYSSN|nr:hypothetical protein NFIA_078390 [Paecilomyces variotii No. 5]
MSDDEDFFDDDYEDEWYWAEDPNPDIADNLAETAQHSPIPVDDPALELVEIFSDWEYYSDDYYDDDPSVVRKLRSTRASPFRSRVKPQGNGHDDQMRNTKKRKLARIDDIPELGLDDEETPPPFERIDASSFKGTVWKKSDDAAVKRVQLYEPGLGEKVALLRNWREVFKDSQPKRNGNGARSPGTSKALSKGNDAARTRGKTQKVSGRSVDTGREDDSLSESGVSRTDVAQQVTEADMEASFTPPPLSINGAEKPAVVVKTKDGLQQKSRSRLRQTATVQDKPPEANDVSTTSRQKSTRNNDDKQGSIAVEIPAPSTAAQRSQRKRKASESVDETESTPPRSKRAAPAKRTKANEQKKRAPSPPSTTVRRSTRTRNGQK